MATYHETPCYKAFLSSGHKALSMFMMMTLVLVLPAASSSSPWRAWAMRWTRAGGSPTSLKTFWPSPRPASWSCARNWPPSTVWTMVSDLCPSLSDVPPFLVVHNLLDSGTLLVWLYLPVRHTFSGSSQPVGRWTLGTLLVWLCLSVPFLATNHQPPCMTVCSNLQWAHARWQHLQSNGIRHVRHVRQGGYKARRCQPCPRQHSCHCPHLLYQFTPHHVKYLLPDWQPASDPHTTQYILINLSIYYNLQTFWDDFVYLFLTMSPLPSPPTLFFAVVCHYRLLPPSGHIIFHLCLYRWDHQQMFMCSCISLVPLDVSLFCL